MAGEAARSGEQIVEFTRGMEGLSLPKIISLTDGDHNTLKQHFRALVKQANIFTGYL